MPETKKVRLAGLWKKEIPSGKTILEGSITPQAIRDALAEVSDDDQKITLTVWLNSDEDKRTAASPDASLVLSSRWQKPKPTPDGVVPF